MQLRGLGTDGHVLNGVTVSAALPTGSAGVATSDPVNIHTLIEQSIQLTISSLAGAFVGTWTVEASNDYVPPQGELGAVPNAGHWTDVSALYTTIASANANATQLIEPDITKTRAGWKYIKVKLTRVSGTSAVGDVYFVGKGR